jgi:hypothetical protein
MKHPARSDFATVLTEAGVSVTFKPTNSIYTFYRLTAGEDVAHLGLVAFAGVQHTGDYPTDEVQAMAQRIASELGASLWSVQEEKEADKQSLRGHSISGDDDVIE